MLLLSIEESHRHLFLKTHVCLWHCMSFCDWLERIWVNILCLLYCGWIYSQYLRAPLLLGYIGPAGTGKTESVKALGNQLGRFVLVFNCDETFDFQVRVAIVNVPRANKVWHPTQYVIGHGCGNCGWPAVYDCQVYVAHKCSCMAASICMIPGILEDNMLFAYVSRYLYLLFVFLAL